MYYYIFTLGPCWRRKKVILHFDVVLNLRRIEGAKKGKNVKKIVFRRKNWQNPQKWQTRAESYKKKFSDEKKPAKTRKNDKPKQNLG